MKQKNYSLSGAMGKLSKLIICIVMLRGRHRGLPVALDRAIMFPTDFMRKANEKAKEIKMKRRTRTAATAGAVMAVEQGEKLSPVNEDVAQ